MVSQQKPRREWSEPQIINSIGCLDLMDRGATCIPLFVRPHGQMSMLDHAVDEGRKPNLSEQALSYVTAIGAADEPESLFYHALAVLHAPRYREENAGALRQDWPRIPLPADRVALAASATLGRQLAALLDVEQSVGGVTVGAIRPELRVVGVISREGGGQLDAEAGELAVTANWGYGGQGGVTMPGKGKLRERDYTPDEQAVLGDHIAALGATPCDIYLNHVAYWRCIPLRVWKYTLGGYQVMKKWLSYREQSLLGRPLKVEEVREVTQMARRIAAILLLETALDANYAAIQSATYPWSQPSTKATKKAT